MQTIEARAILSAADKTGGVFSQIAAKIRALTGTAAQANRVAAQSSRAATLAQRSAALGASANTALLATSARVAGPAALAFGGAKAFKNFADADLRVTRIGVTADATKDQVAGLQKGLRDLGAETAQSFSDVAGGLESLVSGGMELKQAMQALPAIAKTAQASGAEVNDMATTTLALAQNLGIEADKMQTAFDILVKGGKEGKFELKDMARHLPSIAPAAVAAGMKGEEGLMRIVAALQTIRQGTGSTEEAASSLQNIFAKMESETTTKKFKEFGVDVRAEMEKARKEGKDLLKLFVELTDKALKGDLSKVPQLFSDMEFARGMRAMLSFKSLNERVMDSVRQNAGTTAKDLQTVLDTPAMSIKKMSGAWDTLSASIGHVVEQAGKLVNKGGTSGILTDIASTLRMWADEGPGGMNKRLIEEQRQAGIDRQIRDIDDLIANREKTIAGKDPLFGGVDRDRLRREMGEFRVRRFELEDSKRMRDVGGLGALDAEVARIRQETADERRREGNRRLRVPGLQGVHNVMPTADPRKTPMPEVQSLEIKSEVHGEVKGETTVTVKVEPSSEFLRVVNEAKAVAKMAGQIRGNGAGSTGRSSPDAAPSLGSIGAP